MHQERQARTLKWRFRQYIYKATANHAARNRNKSRTPKNKMQTAKKGARSL